MYRVLMICLVILATFTLCATAPDTFTREELEALEQEKSDAESKLAALEAAGSKMSVDLSKLDTQLIGAAMESRRREEQASDAERQLIDLKARQGAVRRELFESETALEDLLAALISSNRRKPPALIVSPSKANDAIRTAILMGNTAPRLQDRAAGLRDEIDELNQIERHIHGESTRLEAAEATLALKKAEIERLVAAKRGHYEDLSTDISMLRTRSAELSQKAQTLRELLDALEANAPATPGFKPAPPITKPVISRPTPSAPSAPPVSASLKPLGKSDLGGLTQPATGNVAYAFGQKLPTGTKSEGLTIVTRADAQVAAPVDGRVEFAKAFRTYGPMLILRTSDEYHVILSGMSEIYVSEGQSISAGEPVGRMADITDPAPELYMELRRGDKVMNPAKWMKR